MRTEEKVFTNEQIFSKISQNQSDEITEWNKKEFLKKGEKTEDQNNIVLELF